MNRKPWIGNLRNSVVLLVVFMLVRCSVEKLSAPSWDVLLHLPLIDKAFSMEDLVDDVDELSVDEPNQRVIFTFENDLHLNVSQFLIYGIPSQDHWFRCNFSQEDSIEIWGQLVLIEEQGIIESAWLRYTFENRNDYQVMLELDMPDLREPNSGLGLSLTRDVAPGETVTDSLFIGGYILEPAVHGSNNYLRYRVLSSGTSGDSIRVYMDFVNLRFSSITGTFQEISASFDNVEIVAPIPKEFEDFWVHSAVLTLTMELGLQIPLKARIEIQGDDFQRARAAPIVIDTTFNSWRGNGRPPAYLLEQDVADFINAVPRRILISGSLKIAEGGVYASVSTDDPARGHAAFRAPLIVRLPPHVIDVDVDTLNIDEDAREIVEDHLQEVTVDAEIENHMPISAVVTIIFSNQRGDSTLYRAPDLIIGPVTLPPAGLAGDPAVVVNPVTGTWGQVFTKETELSVFEKETIFWGARFELRGTEGQMAQVRPSDFIRIKATGGVKVRVKDPNAEDEGGGGL